MSKKIKNFSISGQEVTGSTWALAKMNMFLHGIHDANIKWGDTIRTPKHLNSKGNELEQFDVIVANPPFSLDKWGHDDVQSNKFGRFSDGVFPPKSKGDYAFILHMIKSLKNDGGRLAVVVPHGVLFRGAAEGKIRKMLVEQNLLDAVIGLPGNLFYGTTIPAAILVFKKSRKNTDVLFIDASREYLDGKNQNSLGDEHVKKIIENYKTRKELDRYSHLASLEEIQKNDFNLNIPRYVDTFKEEVEVDISQIQKEIKTLEESLSRTQHEISSLISGLGYE